MNQRGVVHLIIPLLLLLILAAVIFSLATMGVIKIPLGSLPSAPGNKQEPLVVLQKQYQNPFDQSAQYVNPFSESKNPFDLLKI